MPRSLPFVVALAGAAVLASATAAHAQAPPARIHLLHGIPGVAVDVVAGGETVLEDFEFGATQDLSGLAGQTLGELEVRVAGSDQVAIDAGDVTLPASGNYTVIAHLGGDGQPTLGVFENDTTPTAAGTGRLTVRHTAAAPAVDVLAGGQPALTNVVNGQQGSADLPVGTVSASVVPTGATEPVVIGPADLPVEDGSGLVVYAVGSLEDGTIDVLTETITGLTTAPAAVNTGNTPVEQSGGAPGAWAAVLAAVLGIGAVAGGLRLAVARAR
jgi:hypothetical protein